MKYKLTITDEPAMFYATCCMLADFYPRMFERGDKNKKCEGRYLWHGMI